MAPKDCVEKGCTDRMTSLEKDMDAINNPENGALAQMHEKINSKVSMGALSGILVVFLFIVGGAYAYTTLSTSGLKADMKDADAARDLAMDEMKKQIMVMIKDNQDTRLVIQQARDSIDAHRRYTEGIVIRRERKGK